MQQGIFSNVDSPSSITSLSTGVSISSSSSASNSSTRFTSLNSLEGNGFKNSLMTRNNEDNSKKHGEQILCGLQSLMCNRLLCDVTLVAQGKYFILNYFIIGFRAQ